MTSERKKPRMTLIPASAFPLSVSGTDIAGADSVSYRLAGVNWEGAHQDNRVAGGLDKLHRADIIARVIRWGMNHVRFPFSVGMISNKDGTPYTGLVDPARVAANPDLIGMTPWEAYQEIVLDMTAAGLYVIVNQHMLYPGWCCSGDDKNGLWYNDNWPGSVFTQTWIQVGTAFADNPMVGFDIHNEPRPSVIGGVTLNPSWGDGDGATDFRQVYQNTIGRIRSAVAATGSAVKHLAFCEGLSYAGDLTGWRNHPVTGVNIVPSMHDYSWYHKKDDGSQQNRTEYYNAMDGKGGYLAKNGTAPLWIGEFGQDLANRAAMTSGWMANFLSYANARNLHWCWWSLSAQTVRGTEPSTNVLKVPDGNREGFGLMCGQDWEGSNIEMIALLQDLM
jgi:endoglucanase